MDFLNFIKNNLRLSLFTIFVIVLTIYLYIDTRDSSAEIVIPPPDQELGVTEEELTSTEDTTADGTDEIAVIEGEETPVAPIENEPVEDFTTEEGDVEENRPSVIEEDTDEIDGHNKVAENDALALYLKDENLSIIVRDKNTGAVMYSTVETPVQSNEKWQNFVQSAVVIEYLINTNIVYTQADMYTGSPEIEVTPVDMGFEATVHYPELEFGFLLSVLLDDNKLVVEIPQDSIYEDSDTYKMGNLYVYPYLGYSKLDEEAGFMLIPDGSGALISLENNEGQFKQPYSEMVYGQNIGIDEPYVLSRLFNMVTTNTPLPIMAPYFGIVHEDKEFGFLGTIEEGDMHAIIESYPNGAILPYNWTTSKFVLRQFYNQPTSRTTGTMTVLQRNRNDIGIKLNYYFVSGEDAVLMGLVHEFRNFLADTNALLEQTENTPNEFEMKLDFIGSELETGLVSNNSVLMTTFEQAGDIIDQLLNDGLDQLRVVYQGWETNGYSGALGLPTYSVDAGLGGQEGLLTLIEDYNDQVPIYINDDGLRYNPHLSIDVGTKVAKKFNRRVYNEAIFGKVFESFNYLEPEEAVRRLDSRMNSISDFENIALTGITNNIFSYLQENQERDRVHTATIFDEAMSQLTEDKHLILDQPFKPYWQYAEAMYNVPLNSSDYIFEDEQVPFLALALNGQMPLFATYSNFEPNSRDFFLRLVETGVNPSYLLTHASSSELHQTNLSYIYSSQFDLYHEELVNNYNELKQLHEEIGSGIIEDYSSSDNVSVVTYDNQTKVYVNFSYNDAEIDGIELEGQSYEVVK